MLTSLPASAFVLLGSLLGPDAAYDCAVVGKKIVKWHYQYYTGQTTEPFKYMEIAKACLKAGYYD